MRKPYVGYEESRLRTKFNELSKTIRSLINVILGDEFNAPIIVYNCNAFPFYWKRTLGGATSQP
ncbi:hypothetical protein [Lysinibacillus xylanilyticus]|uniref:Uncharacterized protein n=1 Tax=Lysinibacillus xylanilyticus TaxID=582475 RepID=A0ABT4ER52_9BACI|nr:hypothetical protein [Lysinibacillus xylanilyticus]MCY9548105.1 hypothetical protein [Lysinibacillus xylanilyticus]